MKPESKTRLTIVAKGREVTGTSRTRTVNATTMALIDFLTRMPVAVVRISWTVTMSVMIVSVMMSVVVVLVGAVC